MIAMLDRAKTGSLGFAEFRELWDALSAWKVRSCRLINV